MGSLYTDSQDDLQQEIYENAEPAAAGDEQEVYEEPVKVDEYQQHVNIERGEETLQLNRTSGESNGGQITVKTTKNSTIRLPTRDAEKQTKPSLLKERFAAFNWKLILPLIVLAVCLIIAIAALSVAVSKTNSLQLQTNELSQQLMDISKSLVSLTL